MPSYFGRNLLLLFLMTVTTAGFTQEIGTQASSHHELQASTWNLDPELDLSITTLYFTGTDMRKTYSVFPMVGVGASFRMTPYSRVIMGLRYGKKTGNPYYDDDGFESGPDSQLKTLRYLMGVKYNLSRIENFKVYAGYSFALGWAWEDLPFSPSYSQQMEGETSSGLTTGFLISFAPEWTLTEGGQALGVELEYGGTRGELTNNNWDHWVDITGFSGRIYYVIKL